MKLSLTSFAAFTAAAQPRSAGATTTAATTAPSSKQAVMAARKLAEAKQAVATLAAVKTESSDAEKARAAQKVRELRARLQALKMLYAGDPKALARAAAQIARELAGAVKSYVSAGGSAMELGGLGTGDTGGGAAAASPEDAAVEGSPQDATEASGDDDADADGNERAEGQTPGAATPPDEKRAADAARAKADDEFRNEARALARELKAALRRKGGQPQNDRDRDAAEQALAAVDKTLGALPIADPVAGALAGI